MTNRFAITGAVALLTLLAGTARASVPDAPELGPMGGVAGQVLRVSATAIDDELPAVVSIVFLDLLGRPVGPAARLLVLKPGEADGLELNFSLFGKRRSYVRPVVKYSEGSGRALITAEFYDQALGRTVARSDAGDPAGLVGAVRSGPIGLAYGQKLRLALMAVDSATIGCAASIDFHKSGGAVIDPNFITIIDPNDRAVVDPNVRVNLLAGEWVFLELDGSKLVARGGHADLLPAVQMDPIANECIAAVQVYDSSSGWTTVYVPGRR